MADCHTKEQRTFNMSRIRSGGNMTTEVAAVKIFRRNGIIGWRRNYPLPGKPDFVFLSARLAVFVDGCFWHRCPHCNLLPGTNTGYWNPKLARNVRRDREITKKLREKGWRVLRIWEHTLRDPARVLDRLKKSL
jgi:DNA mismatch endonuclease (patch repair protein)